MFIFDNVKVILINATFFLLGNGQGKRNWDEIQNLFWATILHIIHKGKLNLSPYIQVKINVPLPANRTDTDFKA